tara:strand:+ start:1091 stop:2755 length:1665 start_codon:yes stop_codon:yes gene_type:complete
MPQVFSPGEAETRPLDPDAIVYTTAQKVADLLDIGPLDAVLMSANAEANAVFVTGSDYRNIGFSDEDKILIYSDADPMGTTCTITGVSSTASGVKLTFSETINPGLYETTDNGYVQNKASFTNGRTRGITKHKVEDHIKRMQDKIDNMTHNSWRPNLVSAEYINFDTYKPYRRRYYTDYVGTSPLLYRNVQQILRLELWQGDTYREIGAAEAEVNITDYNALSGDSIYLSPGNGSVATLSVGTGTDNWRADFDKITTAQNLADLINKEDRVSKTAVEFSPAFKLEGSTANVAVHNEFLATANSDYGSGKVKITSMRSTSAGETCTIATSDATNITIADTSSATAYSGSVSGSSGTATITLGYTYEDGAATAAASNTTGFTEKGLLQIGDEVVSYTGKTATTFHPDTGAVTAFGTFTGCANVSGTPLTTANTTGTKITQTIFNVDLHGGSSIGDRGRLRDWWIDNEMGIIYFNNSYPFFEWNAIKVAYIYGERYVEKAIEDMCTKMVAVELLLSDDRSVLIPEGTQNVDLASKIQLYKADIERTLPRYMEVVDFG